GAATFGMNAANVTLYAQWAVSAFHVTYDGNGHTEGTVPVDALGHGTGVSVQVKTNSGNLGRTGYTFVGWNTQADGSGPTYSASGAASFTMGTADVTLYAKWNRNSYSVTYDGNGN